MNTHQKWNPSLNWELTSNISRRFRQPEAQMRKVILPKLYSGQSLTSALKTPNDIKIEPFLNPNTKEICSNCTTPTLHTKGRLGNGTKTQTCNDHHAYREYLLVISLGSDVSKSDL